jgi:hypothetical protein
MVPGSSGPSPSIPDPDRLPEETADEPVDRPLLPDELTAIRTTRTAWAGVFTSETGATGSDFCSDDLSRLCGRLGAVGRVCCAGFGTGAAVVDLLLFCICSKLLGVLLNRTILFRTRLFSLTGLFSRLLEGDGPRDDLPSTDWMLPDLRCLRLALEEVDAASALVLLRVFGGDGGFPASDPPSFKRALVRALSFIGTGISSSELSLMLYC